MRIHRIVSFIVDKEKGRPDGKLRMRVRWGNDRRVAVNVGYRVFLDKWSMDSQRCKANTTHGKNGCPASEINAEIQRYEQAAESSFGPFETEGREPTEAEYRSALRSALGREQTRSERPLIYYMREYLSSRPMERGWSGPSQETIRNILFGIAKQDPDLSLKEMATSRWAAGWVAEMTRNNLRNTTIKNRVQMAKMFACWAQERGYVDASDIKAFLPRIKTVPHTVVWLEWDELMAFLRADIPPGERMHHFDELAKDMFCLSCFTSLRISDLCNLKWTDIDDAGIHRVLQKTSVPITIEFNRYSRAIIDKYRSINASCVHVFGEDIPCNSILIAAVRRIAKSQGFDRPITETYFVGAERREETKPLHERLTMHCGRKTFICNALEMGITPQVVMQWTGHSDYKAMKPYIAVSDRAKASAMQSFDK